jgi:hypothetical protein
MHLRGVGAIAGALLAAGGITTAAVLAAPGGRNAAAHTQIVVFESFKGGVGTEAVITKKKGVPYVPGNYAVFRSPLLDGGPGRPRIGTNEAICLHNFTHDMCHGVFTLDGRGTVIFDGLASLAAAPHAHDFAIIGGTGEFAGASGVLHSPAAPGDAPGFTWTITLED